jgi:hypothetical protein
MSSVTRFIRQIQPESTYYSAAAVLAAPTTYAYELIPSAGALGNYPAGYMAAASGALQTALTASTYAANSALLRDMGKTIRAQSPAPAATLATSVRFSCSCRSPPPQLPTFRAACRPRMPTPLT